MKRTSPPLSCLSPSILASRGRGGSLPGAGLAGSPFAHSSSHGSHTDKQRWPPRQQSGVRRASGRTVAPTCRCNVPPTGASPAARPSILRPLTGPSLSPTSPTMTRRPVTHRLFHTSRRLPFRASGALANPASDESHYDTLDLPVDASSTEIKKSFYKLSKLHHPDHNPKDPHAPRRFMRISEAYSVLSHADKRAVYDRDVMRHRPRNNNNNNNNYHPHHAHTHRPNASYHSTGPAGGRPASGLSRRRAAFKGPPPSFYRNTGSGRGASFTPEGGAASSKEQQQKRQQQQQQQQQQYEQQYGHGPGNVNADDRGTRSDPSTPHFDWEATERMHRSIADRAANRRAAVAHGAAFATETSMLAGFMIITAAILASAILPPMLFGSHWSTAAPAPAAVPAKARNNAKQTEVDTA